MRDKKGEKIYEGDSVLVDDPGPGDSWRHSFQGTVDGVDHDEWLVIVMDQDGDVFWVDPLDLEVLEHEEEQDADDTVEYI